MDENDAFVDLQRLTRCFHGRERRGRENSFLLPGFVSAPKAGMPEPEELHGWSFVWPLLETGAKRARFPCAIVVPLGLALEARPACGREGAAPPGHSAAGTIGPAGVPPAGGLAGVRNPRRREFCARASRPSRSQGAVGC